MNIIYTKHATEKIKERNIDEQVINAVIKEPDYILHDKFEDSLFHYIKKVKKKFLRVICKKINENQIIVISAFFDRRLKGSIINDKN